MNSYYGMMYYYYYGVSNIWNVDSGNHGQTFEQALKEMTMAEILQTKVILEHSDLMDIALTDEELAKIDETIDLFKLTCGEDFSKLGISYTEDQLRSYLKDRSIAIKLHNTVKEYADVSSVSGDHKFYHLKYYYVYKSDVASTQEAPTNKDKAEAIKKDIEAGVTEEDIKTKYSLTASAISFEQGVVDEDSKILSEGTQNMSEDEVRVIEAETGWFVALCDNANDEEAAADYIETKKEEIREAAFTELYKGWAAEAKKFKVAGCFKHLKVNSSVTD